MERKVRLSAGRSLDRLKAGDPLDAPLKTA